MIKLYGSGQSRSFRALWALEEAGLQFDYVEITPEIRESDEYRALNPQGKIPTLQEGSLVLTESAAIVNYVASLADQELMPASGTLRAQYDDLCYFILTDFEQPLWTMGKHRFVLPEEQRVEAVLKTALWEFEKTHRVLRDRLGDSEFAIGDQFSMADVLLAQTLGWAERFGMTLAPELVTYRDRHYTRPAHVAALGRVT